MSAVLTPVLAVVAAVLAAAAAAAWVSGGGSRRRLVSCLNGRRPVSPSSAAGSSGASDTTGPGRSGATSAVLARACCGAVLGLVVCVLVRSPWAALVGALAGLALERVLRQAWCRRAERRRARLLTADLPVTAELLAACFHAGADPLRAATVVAEAVGGPVAGSLNRVVSLLALGADPAHAWSRLAHDESLAPLAASLVRAVDTGAPLADTLAAFADDRRHARRAQAQSAAHRVGVHAVAPLGLCFLPAFVLVGVVPVVVGMAAPVLGLVLR